MNCEPVDLVIKIILLGDTGVGKTTFMCKYFEDNSQKSSITTIGMDFKYKIIDICNKRVKI